MVHLRINEKESNPNPHVNFVTVLHAADAQDEENARHLLRALAAQVRPIMKSHGFETNSLEEYEYNTVFAGRNWNAGETIEIVLRRANGQFYPTGWLLSTLCHELAHIKHMNHGPGFQKLWTQLRFEVRQLQDKGYYGDGYWSSGTRLADSTYVFGDSALQPEDVPEYMCGGAHRNARPPRRKRRQPPRFTGPSLHTGQQTEKRRKAGSRVKADVFSGTGTALNEGDTSGKGIGFRKQAGSKKAREERALATERRLQAIKVEDDLEREEFVDEKETDEERRQTLLDSFLTKEESKDMKIKMEDLLKFEDDFRFDIKTEKGANITEIGTTTLGHKPSCSYGSRPAPTNGAKRKFKAEPDSSESEVKQKVPKRESPELSPSDSNDWSCLVCTLVNKSGHLACSACATPKGESIYAQS